jgi:hypothetical protein
LIDATAPRWNTGRTTSSIVEPVALTFQKYRWQLVSRTLFPPGISRMLAGGQLVIKK